MNNHELSRGFAPLATPLLADACLRAGIDLRAAPSGIAPSGRLTKVAGRAVPVRHYGSVDVFLEAFGVARQGDILVVDNGGRLDEGCIGDLTVLEAQRAGVSGVVVWGAHRDHAELKTIEVGVFSYGRFPGGPRRLDPRDDGSPVRFGEFVVTADDAVFADEDGVLFVALDRAAEVLAIADVIFDKERRQADQIRSGRTLREQLRFGEFLERRASDPTYTFRRHLELAGGAIET